MKYGFQFLLFILFIAMVSTSCKKDASKGKAAKLDSLKIEIDSLKVQMDKAWDTMIFEDNKKLDYLKRVIDEAVYILNVDEAYQKRIHNEIEALRDFRYDRVSMMDSKLIDSYDSATNVTIQVVFNFLESLENSGQVPLINDLKVEIMQMDDMIIHRRSHYDEPAMRLNTIIEDNSRELKKLGEPYASMQPKPLFVLNPGS